MEQIDYKKFLGENEITVEKEISSSKTGTIYFCTVGKNNTPSYFKLYNPNNDEMKSKIIEEVNLFRTKNYIQLPVFYKLIKTADLVASIFESYEAYVPLKVSTGCLVLDTNDVMNVINGLLTLNSELRKNNNKFIYKFSRKSIMYHKVTGEIRVFDVTHQETYDDGKISEFTKPLIKLMQKIIPWVSDYAEDDISKTDLTLTADQNEILQLYKELLSNSTLDCSSSPKSVFDVGENYLYMNDVCI